MSEPTPGFLEVRKHGVIVGGPSREFANGTARDQIAMTCVTDSGDQIANAHRLVLCWNAMNGIPSEEIVPNQVFLAKLKSPVPTTDHAALRAAAYKFDDFLNVPPEYEDMRMVRDYRHRAYAEWIPVIIGLKALLDEIADLKESNAQLRKRNTLINAECSDLQAALNKLNEEKAGIVHTGAPVEAYAADDGVEHSHPQYGRGVFFTYNCMKQLYAAPKGDSNE